MSDNTLNNENNLSLELINTKTESNDISRNSQDNNKINKLDKGTENDNVSEQNPNNDEIISKESVITIDAVDKRTRRSLRQEHTYAAKKTVAQGMMDIALITANANQLRYLVEYQRNSATFYINVTLIVLSLLLQIAVGISLIFKGRFDMQGKSKSPQARKINNYMVVGVFLITIINVFVAAFSVTPTNSSSLPVVPTTMTTINN